MNVLRGKLRTRAATSEVQGFEGFKGKGRFLKVGGEKQEKRSGALLFHPKKKFLLKEDPWEN